MGDPPEGGDYYPESESCTLQSMQDIKVHIHTVCTQQSQGGKSRACANRDVLR